MNQVECIECEGTGKTYYSCCGDDIRGNDIDLCPTCFEHCDIEDGEECEMCGGLGYLQPVESFNNSEGGE